MGVKRRRLSRLDASNLHILPLLVLISLIAAGLAFFSLRATTKIKADSSLTLNSIADSYIDSSAATSNFGLVTPLIASASVRRALLKYHISL